jgi:sensor histidine kinase YesM
MYIPTLPLTYYNILDKVFSYLNICSLTTKMGIINLSHCIIYDSLIR